MLELPQPDGFLSAWDVKGVATDVIGELPLPGIEGSPLDPGDIWSVVILASTNQSSIREVCAENHEAPCDDTVFEWLHTLDRGWLEFAANLLFMQLAMTILDPERSRIVSIDFVDNPYHGTYSDEIGELCRMSPKDGTTTCHRYCTAYLVSNGKPITLAMTYVRSDEKQADAVERVLDRVEAYPFEIELLLADSGFYNERVIRRSREIAATVVPVAEKGDRLEEKLETHKSYMTTYRMYKDSERELRFPLAVSVSYQNGDRDKHGEVVRGYAACDLDDRTPTQVEHCYRKRSAIESSYRLFRSARAVTSTQDPIVRFAFVVVSFLLENLWLVLRWAVVARPRRGGRDLPEEFTFSVFCDWIRHALEEELERRWKIEMNGVGVPDAYTAAAG
ncbi:ISH3 family transposase [Halococcus thailandensis]|uniref:ISH3-type transposase ISHwa13 n=1 Tax=Halococcus thailandensis JCM 13552 TaxID=1227457 RepID=M0NGL0_9EURY|nr:ISH3 family transposase [Halococcus thailandensis]EMA56693.1 ISH3-type transposase ISHwa13 [Halococcus thailandensis JCM 13552]